MRVWLGWMRPRRKRLLSAVIHTGMALPPVVVGLALYLLLSRSGPLAALGWLFTPRGDDRRTDDSRAAVCGGLAVNLAIVRLHGGRTPA